MPGRENNIQTVAYGRWDRAARPGGEPRGQWVRGQLSSPGPYPLGDKRRKPMRKDGTDRS
jgi:hypothetical protein